MTEEIKAVTLEEARKLAQLADDWDVETDGNVSLYRAFRDALRSLAGQVEKCKEYLCVNHGYSSCPDCVDAYRKTEKELAEARAEIEGWRRLVDSQRTGLEVGLQRITAIEAERDALQAKYDAADSAVTDIMSVIEDRGHWGEDFPSELCEEGCPACECMEIAAKLANAAEEGKRGKA